MPTYFEFDSFILAVSGILLLMGYGYLTKKADPSGVFAGGLIALVLYLSIQWEGLVYFFVFFIVGSLASKWKYKNKEKQNIAQENKGKRSAVHALSNAGPAAVLSLFTFLGFHYAAKIAVASVFAAALSDTLSSEIGNIIGKKHVNILSLKKDTKGRDGVISLEGILAGAVGSASIGILSLFYHSSVNSLLVVFFVGMVANLLDSVLGASLQRKGYLNNHQVNFVTTLFAGILGLLIALFILL